MPRRTKDAAIALLVVLNVVLLCTVLAHVLHLPQASAQIAGPGGDRFLALAGAVQSGLDATYVIDLEQQRLYVLGPRSGGTVLVQLTDARDLRADFSRQASPTIPPRTR